MPERKKLQCNNCGNEWEDETLTNEERKALEHTPQNVGPIHCPRCKRTDVKIKK